MERDDYGHASREDLEWFLESDSNTTLEMRRNAQAELDRREWSN